MIAPELVLVVTHSGDFFTVDRVSEAVARLGARPVRLDTDRFPIESRLAFSVGASASSHRFRDDTVGFAADDVHAAWLRRVFPPRLPEDLDERFRAGVATQASVALSGFLAGLDPTRVVDPPARVDAAENKILQLTAARAAGLTMPATLVTNDPDEVREFFHAQGGRIVTKLLHPLSQAMGRAPQFVYTSAVTEDDLDDLESLTLSPMIFQARVEKDGELRAIYVGGRFFTGAIDARDTTKGQVDWRRADVGEAPWKEAELPSATVAAAGTLMERLGLRTGAFDFIRTPDGAHVFLEVNPQGEWGMLERDLGLPISQAIAELLVRSA